MSYISTIDTPGLASPKAFTRKTVASAPRLAAAGRIEELAVQVPAFGLQVFLFVATLSCVSLVLATVATGAFSGAF
jgi:hypothetical protein